MSVAMAGLSRAAEVQPAGVIDVYARECYRLLLAKMKSSESVRHQSCKVYQGFRHTVSLGLLLLADAGARKCIHLLARPGIAHTI